MNDTGPEASAPTRFTSAPFGRRVEKSCPMPPPCCMVSDASLRLSKIPPMSSGTVPMTKQLKSVTARPDPAPASTRPAGRKRKSCRMPRNLSRHSARWSGRSASDTAPATRAHVSAIVSSPPAMPAPFIRYLRSQICREISPNPSIVMPQRPLAGTVHDAHERDKKTFPLCSGWRSPSRNVINGALNRAYAAARDSWAEPSASRRPVAASIRS